MNENVFAPKLHFGKGIQKLYNKGKNKKNTNSKVGHVSAEPTNKFSRKRK